MVVEFNYWRGVSPMKAFESQIESNAEKLVQIVKRDGTKDSQGVYRLQKEMAGYNLGFSHDEDMKTLIVDVKSGRF